MLMLIHSKKFVIISSLIIFAITTTIALSCYSKGSRLVFKTKTGEVSINVEVVDTPGLRTRGLMWRDALSKDGGMLFVFPVADMYVFWMKNTLISLDMFFINKEMKVVDIVHNAVPCIKEPCELYQSNQPVMYVVETNAGFARKNGIVAGDRVDFAKFF